MADKQNDVVLKDSTPKFLNSVTEHPDVQRLIGRITKLQMAIESVAKKLRKKRIHPLDIIPIENPNRLANELEQALAELENCPECEQHRWIPVTERLPKPRVKVLTIGSEEPPGGEREPAVAWMGEDGKTWWTYGNDSGFYKPAHWMPIILPEVENEP